MDPRRGAEHTYRLRLEAASVSAEEGATLTAEKHRQMFTAFVDGGWPISTATSTAATSTQGRT
jgi:hypothetical protein